MSELNIFERFVIWLKSMFISEKKREENSDELKRKCAVKYCKVMAVRMIVIDAHGTGTIKTMSRLTPSITHKRPERVFFIVLMVVICYYQSVTVC